MTEERKGKGGGGARMEGEGGWKHFIREHLYDSLLSLEKSSEGPLAQLIYNSIIIKLAY